MKIPIITKLFQRWARKRLRYVMRGYRCLKISNQLDKITVVKVFLTNTKLSQCEGRVSRLILGEALKDAERIIRQYLLVRIGGLNLNKALLYALGKPGSKVVYPLPLEWQIVLCQNGFEVAKGRSTLLYNGYVFLLLAYGFTLLVRQFFGDIKEIIRPRFSGLGRFAYFDMLTTGTLPQFGKENHSYDVVSWYQQWHGRVRELDTLCHNVKSVASSCVTQGMFLTTIPSAILPLNGIKALMCFVGWGAAAGMLAVLDLLRGRWWHALLFNEALLGTRLRIQNPKRIAKDYLFHNSNWIYRPLWSYEAEKLGARISFYFYSTNCELFKRLDGYPAFMNYGWQAMNWPCYLVWDKYQADFVHRAVGESANVSVVGPIWFHTSKVEVKKLPLRAIAVFDVQPVRDAFYQSLGIDFDYYTPHTTIQFLADIYTILSEYDCALVLKRKRNSGRLVHPKYRNFVKQFDKLQGFVSIDPDISAIELIKECKAVISMPFTSTALLGRELGKPSIYYDPHGLIQRDDRGAHGIEVLCDVHELRVWVANIVGG